MCIHDTQLLIMREVIVIKAVRNSAHIKPILGGGGAEFPLLVSPFSLII